MKSGSTHWLRTAALCLVVTGSACTAGEIIDSSGQGVFTILGGPGYEVVSTVTFQSTSDPSQSYSTNVSWNAPNYKGIPTFSVDYQAPASEYNRQDYVPEGNYIVRFEYGVPSQNSKFIFTSDPVDHSYEGGKCTDDITGKIEACSLYRLNLVDVVYDNGPAKSPCGAVVRNGPIATVPMCGVAYISD